MGDRNEVQYCWSLRFFDLKPTDRICGPASLLIYKFAMSLIRVTLTVYVTEAISEWGYNGNIVGCHC